MNGNDPRNPLTAIFAQPQFVHEYSVKVPQERIEEILARVKTARIPRQMPPPPGAKSAWETGMDTQWLEGLRQYWINGYEWRKAEMRLNSYPQYMARVDDFDIQFYYVKGEGDRPLPLVLTHGWPGSILEFLNVIGPLSEPSKHGAKVEDAFTLIIPSLPGFGFSSMPEKPIQAITTAKLWHKLITEVIGHQQYVCQGGDLGAAVTVQLAYLYPNNVKAVHFNLTPWFSIPEDQRTEAEKEWLAEGEKYLAREMDYFRMQINKPMMPAVALADSPLGTAAWIAEKFWAWSDHDGDLEKVISKDDLLTDIMLYLVNSSGIEGSFWLYRAIRDELGWNFFPGFINTPTAIAVFPKDYPMGRPSLETAKRAYNVVHYSEMPRGGHFAALEQPQLFVEDLREALRAFH